MQEKPSRRIFGLDVMRAIAIALVVWSHAVLFFPKAGAGFFGELWVAGLACGYFGVELFFVLSGFLIGGILLGDFAKNATAAGLRHFWVRRWFRTLPNYFLFIGLNVALAFSLGTAVPPVGAYFVFLQNFTAPPPAFFVESWSLSIEEWFYLLAPAAILLFVRGLRIPLKRAVLLAGLLVIAAVTAARLWYVGEYGPPWLLGVRVITCLRLDACMFGVLGAWVCRYYPEFWIRARRPAALLGLGLVGMVLAAMYVPGMNLDPRTAGFTLTSLGALCFLPALEGWREARGPLAAGTTRLSLWSYSLYLMNYPAYVLCAKFLAPASVGGMIFAILVFLAVSVGLSALNYRFFERPMMQLRDRRAPKEFPGEKPGGEARRISC